MVTWLKMMVAFTIIFVCLFIIAYARLQLLKKFGDNFSDVLNKIMIITVKNSCKSFVLENYNTAALI